MDTLMGIVLTILKHKDLMGLTTYAVGNFASAVNSVTDAQQESRKFQAIK